MRNLRTLPAAVAVVAILAPALAAGPDDRRPRLHRAALDGAPVSVELPAEGRTVSAWTWWDAGETDIAVAIRNADGRWSDPFFFGRRDGVDQLEPAMTADPAGNVYLLFANRQTGSISLALLGAGREVWTAAFDLVPAGSGASAPSLRIVRDRLVVAWKAGRTVQILDIPLVGGTNRPLGVQDGPDGFNPLGQQPSVPANPGPGAPGKKPPKN